LKTGIVGFGSRIEQCEKKVEENIQRLVSSISSKLVEMEVKILNEERPTWSALVAGQLDSRLSQATTYIISAQTLLQQQTKAIIEDKQNQEEVNKRRYTVIIHGLAEFEGENWETRATEDDSI